MNLDQYVDIITLQATVLSQVKGLKDVLYDLEENVGELGRKAELTFKADAKNNKKKLDT